MLESVYRANLQSQSSPCLSLVRMDVCIRNKMTHILPDDGLINYGQTQPLVNTVPTYRFTDLYLTDYIMFNVQSLYCYVRMDHHTGEYWEVLSPSYKIVQYLKIKREQCGYQQIVSFLQAVNDLWAKALFCKNYKGQAFCSVFAKKITNKTVLSTFINMFLHQNFFCQNEKTDR